MNEGLVAPSWSDSGDVPVGDVTYTWELSEETIAHLLGPVPNKRPADPNAKPSMSALSKVADESYRGLGWCDE